MASWSFPKNHHKISMTASLFRRIFILTFSRYWLKTLKIQPNSFVLFCLSTNTRIDKSQINIFQFWIHFVYQCHAVLSIWTNCNWYQSHRLIYENKITFWKFYGLICIISWFDWWWICHISCPICLNGSDRVKKTSHGESQPQHFSQNTNIFAEFKRKLAI